MRQFDVLANPAERSRRLAPYLVIIQSHYLISLDTTLVAPLMRPGAVLPDGLFGLSVEFRDTTYTLAMQQMFSTPTMRLGKVVGDLSSYDLQIARAWDRLFTGF